MEPIVNPKGIKKEYENGHCEYIVSEQWQSNEIKLEPHVCVEETAEQLQANNIDIEPTKIAQDGAMEMDTAAYHEVQRSQALSKAAGVSTNICAGQAFNQILSEIRTMNEVYQSMFHTLTEEIINLRNEVSQLRALPTTESVSNLLPTLPLPTLVKFQEFDQKLLAENDLRVNLKNFLLRVGGSDLSAFTRLALRRILSDEASTNITWCGTNDKPSFQSFATFNVIKEIGFLRFSYATDVDIHKICQQHFLHAKDRINKKLKTKTKKLNINDTI